jgi:hypothetical protein
MAHSYYAKRIRAIQKMSDVIDPPSPPDLPMMERAASGKVLDAFDPPSFGFSS